MDVNRLTDAIDGCFPPPDFFSVNLCRETGLDSDMRAGFPCDRIKKSNRIIEAKDFKLNGLFSHRVPSASGVFREDGNSAKDLSTDCENAINY